MRRPIDEDSKTGGLDSSGEAGGAGGGGGGGGGKGGKKRKNSLLLVRRPLSKCLIHLNSMQHHVHTLLVSVVQINCTSESNARDQCVLLLFYFILTFVRQI